MTDNIDQIGINAKKAARILAKTSSEQKNHALQAMSKYVLADKKIILEANKLDIENSKSKKLFWKQINEILKIVNQKTYLNLL